MIQKDGKDVSIEALTPEQYIVPKGEERYYHCIVEVRQFDRNTGRKLSKARLQKFGKKAFERHIADGLRQQGYTVTVLHNPTEWLKAHEVEVQKSKAEKEAAKEAEIQARIDAAVAKAIAALKVSEKAAKTPKKAKAETKTAEQASE